MAVCLALAGAPLRASASWEQTRQSVIEPMNAAFHRTLPRSIRQRDLAAILDLYAIEEGTGLSWDWASADLLPSNSDEEVLRWHGPGANESIRSRYERILELFQSVESAELRIESVDWDHPTPDGYSASIHLIVRGEAGAVRRQLDQRVTASFGLRGGKWKITREEIMTRELASGIRPRFTLATQAAGIDNVHDTDGSPPFRIVGGYYTASGSAIGDVDADGDEDVVLASASHLVLYRNNGDGTFTEVTATSGLPNPYPAVATGVALFDYDNDGFPDLYVAAIRGGDRLFHNRRDGTFEDVSAAARIKPGEWASMPVVADYDRDGYLDIYIVRMGDHEHTPPSPNYDAHNGFANTLYHNNGDGTFSDVSERAGVADTGWGLAGAWGDYDDDGWPDFYVANEFGLGALYHNEHDGTFRDVTRASGTANRAAAMSVAWADYDNDGHLDLFVSAMHANSRWLLFHPDFPEPLAWYYKMLGWFTPQVHQRLHEYTHELTRGSSLLHNNGDGTFTDVSDRAGVRDTQWGWAAEFVDYNNDGLLDLYATNGFISGPLLDDV
jgi:VCBS repeat protein